MNDSDLPELEELPDEAAQTGGAEAAPAFAPDPAAAAAAAAAPAAIHYAAAPAAPAQPAHKQLYQFLWGGIAVLFGCLLPMHDVAVDWDPEQFQPGIQGSIGLMTVGGAITAFFAILVIGAQIYCMTYRKLLLSPIVIMLGVAAWGWFHVVPGMGAIGQFGPADQDPYSIGHLFYKADAFTNLWSHIGVGYLFVVGGSTYVILVFLKEMLGMGGKKKTADAGATAGGGDAGGKRGRRRR